jgi:hypothetical protein
MNYPFIDLSLSNKDYHSRSEISKSDLDIILQSPGRLQYSKLLKKKQTPAMILGSLFHTLVLQPELFDQEYAFEFETKLQAEFQIDGKVDKDAWNNYKYERDNYKNTVGNKTIVDVDTLATCKAMRDSVMSNNTARALLKDAIIESSAFWNDEETGIPCRCRPDIAWPSKILVDLKSCEDASYNEFRRQIVKYNYDLQAYHYLNGYSQATGVTYDTFVFIVCEKNPPYGVAVYAINDAVVEAGGQIQKRALKNYSAWLNCEENSIYKGIYPDEIQSIDMAAYGFSTQDR